MGILAGVTGLIQISKGAHGSSSPVYCFADDRLAFWLKKLSIRTVVWCENLDLDHTFYPENV